MVPLLKSGVLQGTVGSNPTPSATSLLGDPIPLDPLLLNSLVAN